MRREARWLAGAASGGGLKSAAQLGLLGGQRGNGATGLSPILVTKNSASRDRGERAQTPARHLAAWLPDPPRRGAGCGPVAQGRGPLQVPGHQAQHTAPGRGHRRR
jgi:hypothetical protein